MGCVTAQPLRLDLVVPALFALVLFPVSLIAALQTPEASPVAVVVVAVLFLGLHAASLLASRHPLAAFAAVSAIMLTLALFPLATGITGAIYPSALAFLLCLYQVAVRCPWKYSGAAIAVAVIGSALIAVTAPELMEPIWQLGAFLGLAAASAAAWAFGLLQRVRDQREAEREHERLRSAVAEERARMSADLHDVVAHSLTVMLAQAEVARGFLRERPDVSEQALDVVLDSGRDALRGMRAIVRDDQDAPREPVPDLGALDRLIDTARSPDTRIDLVEEGDRGDLATPVLLALLAVVREGVANGIRHTAAPRALRVHIAWAATLTVTIDDDGGAGPSDSGLGTGTGLAGLAERVRVAGGTLASGPHEGGWRVRASLPTEIKEDSG